MNFLKKKKKTMLIMCNPLCIIFKRQRTISQISLGIVPIVLMDGFEGPTMGVHPQAGSQNGGRASNMFLTSQQGTFQTFSNLAKVELHPFGIKLALPRTKDSLVF
jgi:hypothetical protein